MEARSRAGCFSPMTYGSSEVRWAEIWVEPGSGGSSNLEATGSEEEISWDGKAAGESAPD